MAIRCSTALVEPPSAITTTMAFSKAWRVMMSRGLMSFSKQRADRLARRGSIRRAWPGSSAGVEEL